MTGLADMHITQGATDNFTFQWKVDGTPVDLTGWTANFQVRSDFRATVTILNLTSASSGPITLDDQGHVIISFSDSLTSALSIPTSIKPKLFQALSWYKLGRYNVEMVDPANHITRIIEGDFYLNPEVVR